MYLLNLVIIKKNNCLMELFITLSPQFVTLSKKIISEIVQLRLSPGANGEFFPRAAWAARCDPPRTPQSQLALGFTL